MSLKQTKARGFTIVELLIVIVVIAILAAITIVAYNGIQNRAKTSSGQSAANNVIKKLEALNAIKGAYSTTAAPGAGYTSATMTTYANAAPAAGEAVVDDAAAVIAATSNASGATLTATAANNGSTVAVWACPLGAEVYYYDFTKTSAQQTIMTAGAGC